MTCRFALHWGGDHHSCQCSKMLDVNPYPIVTKLLADDFDSFQSMQFCSGFQRQCVQHDGQQLSLSCYIDFEPNVAPPAGPGVRL